MRGEDPTVWISSDGRETPICELNEKHLDNIIAMLLRNTSKWLQDWKAHRGWIPADIRREIEDFARFSPTELKPEGLCFLIYPEWGNLRREQSSRKEVSKTKDIPIPTSEPEVSAMASVEKIFKAGIQRESGWLYYFNIVEGLGCIMRTRTTRSGQKKSPGDKPGVVLKTDVNREDGFLYYLDKEGDVSRVKANNGGTARKPKTKRAPRRTIKSTFPKDGWYHSNTSYGHLLVLVKGGKTASYYNYGRVPQKSELNEFKIRGVPATGRMFLGPYDENVMAKSLSQSATDWEFCCEENWAGEASIFAADGWYYSEKASANAAYLTEKGQIVRHAALHAPPNDRSKYDWTDLPHNPDSFSCYEGKGLYFSGDYGKASPSATNLLSAAKDWKCVKEWRTVVATKPAATAPAKAATLNKIEPAKLTPVKKRKRREKLEKKPEAKLEKTKLQVQIEEWKKDWTAKSETIVPKKPSEFSLGAIATGSLGIVGILAAIQAKMKKDAMAKVAKQAVEKTEPAQVSA